MLKGFNSDVSSRGSRYHVQTEDWGTDNPFLVTRVYRDGAVVKTLKTPYTTALQAASVKTTDALRTALQRQHADVVDALISGQLP